MSWTLILYATLAGAPLDDYQKHQTVQGFSSQEQCQKVGRDMAQGLGLDVHNVLFVCLPIVVVAE